MEKVAKQRSKLLKKYFKQSKYIIQISMQFFLKQCLVMLTLVGMLK